MPPVQPYWALVVYFHVHSMNEYNVPANGADTSQYEDKNEDQSLKTLKCKSNFRLKILSAHGCSGY